MNFQFPWEKMNRSELQECSGLNEYYQSLFNDDGTFKFDTEPEFETIKSYPNNIKVYKQSDVTELIEDAQIKAAVVLFMKNDEALAEEILHRTWGIINASTLTKEFHQGPCICEYAEYLGEAAYEFGMTNLANMIEHGTICPNWNDSIPTKLEIRTRRNVAKEDVEKKLIKRIWFKFIRE